MPTPFKINQRGKFFDVHSGKNNIRKWFFFWRNGGVVDLRHRRHRLWIIGSIFLLIIVSFFGLKNLFTRAEVISFHASTCLGSWQNPEKAQGKPENLTIKSSLLSEENSAIFWSSDNQIFCGQFVPEDFETEGNIKNISLTFVWEVQGFDNADQGIEVIETPMNLDQESQSETDSEPETTNSVETAPEDKTTNEEQPTKKESEPQNEEVAPEGPTSFIRFIRSNPAHAQTPSSETENTPPEIILTEPAEPVTEPVESAPVETAEPENADDADAEEIGSENLPEPESDIEKSLDEAQSIEEVLEILKPQVYEPTEHFLKINYSLDGQDWLELETVGPDNWQN